MLLLTAGATFKTQRLWDGCQVILYDDEGQKVDDAVWHCFSHGHEKGLLETYILNKCAGYETAYDVFNGWMKMLNR